MGREGGYSTLAMDREGRYSTLYSIGREGGFSNPAIGRIIFFAPPLPSFPLAQPLSRQAVTS